MNRCKIAAVFFWIVSFLFLLGAVRFWKMVDYIGVGISLFSAVLCFILALKIYCRESSKDKKKKVKKKK